MNILIKFIIGFISSVTIFFIVGNIITWFMIKDLKRRIKNEFTNDVSY